MASTMPLPVPGSGSGGRTGPLRRGHLGLLATVGSLAFSPCAAASHDPECPRWQAVFLGMPVRTVVIGTATGAAVQVSVRVAATDEARRAAFQCATAEEIAATAILFDFGAEVLRGFHMWNVPAPLGSAFARASGRIVSILRTVSGARESHGPMARFRYALETRAGFFRDRVSASTTF